MCTTWTRRVAASLFTDNKLVLEKKGAKQVSLVALEHGQDIGIVGVEMPCDKQLSFSKDRESNQNGLIKSTFIVDSVLGSDQC